jgi:hypothetical protein
MADTDDVVSALTGEFQVGQRVVIAAHPVAERVGQRGRVAQLIGVAGERVWYGVALDVEGSAYTGRWFAAEDLAPESTDGVS